MQKCTFRTVRSKAACQGLQQLGQCWKESFLGHEGRNGAGKSVPSW